MTTKRTYSVRLDDAQREKLEERSAYIGLTTAHLIRLAIEDFLRQQEEKDYLGEVQAAISTSIAKLSRQVEKDRAEQQLIVGVLDYIHDWLAFVLPSPPDGAVAAHLREERRKVFHRELPTKFISQSRAQLTKYVEDKHIGAIQCPTCKTGQLRKKPRKQGGWFWYCSNWNAVPDQCSVTFADDLGQPVLP